MIGFISLLVALTIVEATILLYVNGIHRKQTRLIEFGKKGVLLTCAYITIASLWLFYLLVSRDFQTVYVAHYTSRDLPLLYTISAFWAGTEGSLLFWVWLLSIFAVVIVLGKGEEDKLIPYTVLVLSMVISFFLILLLYPSNPFVKFDRRPADGYGLNPLLQDSGMLLHPPTLFVGYAGFTVPFAFAMAGLITENNEWIFRVRKWTLFSWIFLSVGIGMGAWWSYHVLGWGGYWAWDPVENASLMPWLTATAFLHSVMIQEGKGGMKVWNVLLIMFTFLLVIYATFLTRSGIIQSVHAFAQSPIGTYFLIFMLLTLLSSLGLLMIKIETLKSRNIFEAYLSKETAFLFNNLVFIVLTIVIFYGTTFPLVSEAIRGYQVGVRAGYYNETFLPLALVLMALMGVCPLIAWRRVSIANLKRNFIYPLILTLGALFGLLILGVSDAGGILASSISVFVTSTVGQEFYRGVKAEGNAKGLGYIKNLLKATGRNRRKYGGYIIHLSIILILIGVAGSSLYEVSMRFTLRRGESFSTGEYMLKLKDVTQNVKGDKAVTITRLEIYQAGEKIHEASPSITYYPRQRQWLRNVYIYSTVWNDLYLIFFGSQEGRYAFAFKVIPLVNFIWAGIAIMILGTIIATWPERRKILRRK